MPHSEHLHSVEKTETTLPHFDTFPRSDRVHIIALQCTELVHLIVPKPVESLVVCAHVFYIFFL